MEIGYACKLIGVSDVSFSSCTLKNCTEDRLVKIIKDNLDCLDHMIDYNIKMGIKLFRISSDIIPFGFHPVNEVDWRRLYKHELEAIGEKINRGGIRVSMHPGQYTVLNSLKLDVVEKSRGDLLYHCNFLDALQADYRSKIVMHIGGVYGDKKQAKERFVEVYRSLPPNAKKRLIIENDDKNFNIQDVLEIGEKEKIPVVFDNLHHQLNLPEERKTEVEWIKEGIKTWDREDGTPKTHYSQQKIPGPKGAHSDTIHLETFKNYYHQLTQAEINVDIMLEVKDKNLSAIKCINGVSEGIKIRVLEEEWARYKYFVLGKSAHVYNEIRQLLKDKENPDSLRFYNLIEQAGKIEEKIGSQVNGVQHVWGYVNKNATSSEHKRYNKLFQEYQLNGRGLESIKKHIFKMAVEQEQDFLIKSLYFFL